MAVNDSPAVPARAGEREDREAYGVAYDVTDAVAVIELRGPTGGNALDAHMRSALLTAVRRLTTDAARGVRAALITARGKNFSVGQDLTEHARLLKTSPPGRWRTFPTTTTHW